MMFSQSMERHQVCYIYLTATCIYLCTVNREYFVSKIFQIFIFRLYKFLYVRTLLFTNTVYFHIPVNFCEFLNFVHILLYENFYSTKFSRITVLSMYMYLSVYYLCTCIYLSYLSIQAFFIKAGIYLILEKLKTVAMRNLFKRVYVIIT